MTGITNYFLRQMTAGMMLVSAGLACVLWLTQSLRFIEMIVNQGISAGTFLSLTALLMPSFLVIIFPIALFSVILFTLNKLNNDRELVVLRAAGLSDWSLARPALILAATTTVISYVLTLWAIPFSVQSFREMQWSIRNDVTSVLLQEGVFNKFGAGLTIYVRERSGAGELLDILVHDKRNPDKPVTLTAERGALVFTETGPRVLMVNGNRQQLPENSGRLSVLNFDSYTVDLTNADAKSGARFRDARERSMGELLNADEAELGPVDYRRAKVEFHQRLVSPVYNIGFALIAAAALLSTGFNRRGQTRSILTAVAIMVAVQAGALGIANIATSNLAFLPLLYIFAALPPIVGSWVLLRPFGSKLRPI